MNKGLFCDGKQIAVNELIAYDQQEIVDCKMHSRYKDVAESGAEWELIAAMRLANALGPSISKIAQRPYICPISSAGRLML